MYHGSTCLLSLLPIMNLILGNLISAGRSISYKASNVTGKKKNNILKSLLKVLLKWSVKEF